MSLFIYLLTSYLFIYLFIYFEGRRGYLNYISEDKLRILMNVFSTL